MSWQPYCAMKTLVDGYFYVPTPTGVTLQTLKVDLLFSYSGLEGDQTDGTSPYSTIKNWPNGIVDLSDQAFVNGLYGKRENQSGWNYMADVVPDRFIQLSDMQKVNGNYGKRGTYSTDLTGVTITFSTGDVHTPNADGYVTIPAGATYFYVMKAGAAIGALITFYTQALVTYTLTLNVDKTQAFIGEVITFTGNLSGDGTPVSGAIVTLYKNGVALSPTTNTNTSGNYSFQWTADAVGNHSFYTQAVW